jgi:hypothetical protein
MTRRHAVALAIALLTAGCDSGSPAVPTVETPVEAGAAPGYAVCPQDMDATFGSIYAELLTPPQTCGSTNGGCHLRDDEAGVFPTSNLAYSYDAAAVYAELLGDGGGAPAFNASNTNVHVLRVDPGHADASMLYIKLTLDTSHDPQYGAGMPLTAPASVCPAAVNAVADWINAGAPAN